MKNPLIVQITFIGLKDLDTQFFPIPFQKCADKLDFYYKSVRQLYAFLVRQQSVGNIEEFNNTQICKQYFYKFQDIYDEKVCQFVKPIMATIDERLCILFQKQFIESQDGKLILQFRSCLTLNYLENMRKDVGNLEYDYNLQKVNMQKIQKQLEKLQRQLQQNGNGNEKAIQQEPLECIDVGILYSNPLVYKEGQHMKVIPSVGYHKEITSIINQFEQQQLGIKYCVMNATIENLRKMLHMRPKILQIISHGEFDKQTQSFYLAFEKNGGMEVLGQQQIPMHFSHKQGIELVILSSCHSGEIAGAIQIYGCVPFVVAVQSEYKIEDNASQVFAATFFKNLTMGVELYHSFQLAVQGVVNQQGEKRFTGCCPHQHYPNCPHEYGNLHHTGSANTHDIHVPNCSCLLKCEQLHDWFKEDSENQCKWASKFICELFGPMNENIDESYFEFREGRRYLKVCCCEIQQINEMIGQSKYQQIDKIDKMIHDESLKFRLKNSRDSNVKLFDDQIPKGKPIQINPRPFHEMLLIGRQLQIYEIYQFILLNQINKVLNIHGPEGSGKTALIENAIQYIIERQNLAYHIIDINNIDTMDDLKHHITQQVKVNSFSELLQTLNQSHLILDNADQLHQHTISEFVNLIHVCSPHSTLIITTKHKIHHYTKRIELHQFNKQEAQQLLMEIINKNNIEVRQDTFNQIPLYPKNIIKRASELLQRMNNDILI